MQFALPFHVGATSLIQKKTTACAEDWLLPCLLTEKSPVEDQWDLIRALNFHRPVYIYISIYLPHLKDKPISCIEPRK